jgi:uncharacterized protein (TIGR03437 family)
MRLLPVVLAILFVFNAAIAATFGTVVPVVGGVTDLVLDEPRGRLYLVNSTRNQIEIYSIPQRRFLDPIPVEALPLAAALSRDGRILYVTSHDGNSLLEIDLDLLAVVSRVSMPAKPEGVAVAGDGRVLISTVGTGQNNLFNVLLVYDPNAVDRSQALAPVPVLPPPPANPLLPPQNFGRPALVPRSFLASTPDGKYIIGVNIPNATARAVFVYETASGSVLRSRTMAGVSPVLSVSPDGTKFMAGLHLMETETLQVIAQQNAANAPYPFAAGTNFNLQQNQGGSIFSPDGQILYTAFNFAPVQQPPARPNVSQLMVNDPDNLLIRTAFQMPENLAGQMVITSDGGTIFAISESGFLTIPIGQAQNSPIASVETNTLLLLNDQCGVTREQRVQTLAVRNTGRGNMIATAALLQQTPAGPGGLGGVGGPGGGIPGGGVIIIIPPVAPGGGQPGGVPVPPVLPGGQPTGQNAAIAATAPMTQVTPVPGGGSNIRFQFNPNAARSLGTALPTHQFLIQSPQAINIPSAVRVFQNNRNAEANGTIVPIQVGLSANEGLVDMIQDTARRRLYIANSAMNRVEVFDTRTREMLPPIKVGQLPRGVAMSADGQTLYVINSGGESISIVDLQTMTTVGRVRFPPTPFNANVALVTPRAIASSQRGPLVMMSNGTLWRIVGDEAVPRRFSSVLLPPNNQGVQVLPQPATMASTPNGENIIILARNGTAYLYDAQVDDFIQSRTVSAQNPGGFFGPVAAGPRGQYFLVNNQVLNQSLTPIASSTPLGAPAGQVRRVAAVAAISATTYARFAQPPVANANAVITTPPAVEIADTNTANMTRQGMGLETPLSTPIGNQTSVVAGRTMEIDPSGNTAYVLTASGLSIVEIGAAGGPGGPGGGPGGGGGAAATRPAVNPNGVVNIASYTTQIAQGGLISIFGRNLGQLEGATETPLPTMLGGTCVTLNNRPLPLLLMSPEQINAQVPPDLAAGRYPLVVRSIRSNDASAASQVSVSRYAPSVIVDPNTGLPAIYHPDGRPVSKENPARRDRTLTLYAIGLGPTTGGRVVAGEGAPLEPLAETAKVQVFFGDPTIDGTEIIVEWSGLVPGFVGLYQINLRVPGSRWRGDNLPVVVRVAGVSSPTVAPVVPYVSVE